MKFLLNTYLVRLFKQNKILFVFVIVFIFFQQYFYKKEHPTFPWFIWAMYYRNENINEYPTQKEFLVNGKRIDITQFSIWQEATIINTSNKYLQMQQNNWIDPLQYDILNYTKTFSSNAQSYFVKTISNNNEAAQQYPDWLKHYLENKLDYPVNTIELKEVTYHYYDGKFHVENDTSLVKFNFE